MITDIAREVIEKEKKERTGRLDLGRCGLTEIPLEVWTEMPWLEWLSLSNEWFDWERRRWTESANSGEKNYIPATPPPAPCLPLLRSLTLAGEWDAQWPLADIQPIRELRQLQHLNLYNTQVADIQPIKELRQLQWLDLSNTLVANIQPLKELKQLQELNLAGTQVADIQPIKELNQLQKLDLGSTQVADIQPLKELNQLQYLDLSYTRVADTQPLKELNQLQYLYLSRTQVENIQPLRELRQLHTLDLSETQVADLQPISKLSQLQQLYLAGTQVADIQPIKELNQLQTLDLRSTQVADIQPILPLLLKEREITVTMEKYGGGFNFHGCPLTNPPTEIVAQGREAVLDYFAAREKQGTSKLYEAKVLFLGEGGAGKTSLITKLLDPQKDLPQEEETTKGIDIYHYNFQIEPGKTMRLNLWDFGGQEIYHATHQFFLTKRSLYILLDDTRNNSQSVHDRGFKFWLEAVETYGENSPVLIFQNEKGGRPKKVDMKGIVARFNNVKEKYKGDLKNDPACVGGIRLAIEFHARQLPHIGEELPSKWVELRNEIQEIAREKQHIRLEDYYKLYTEKIESDKGKALILSQYYHDLGVFLHFQNNKLLKRLIILQNSWATDAAYKVLDDKQVESKFGRFDEADCERFWNDPKYVNMHPELLELMKSFELCYELADTTPATWLVPGMLKPSIPDALDNWAQTGDLVLKYKYDFMPKGLINRLMVRMNRYVTQPELCWREGVYFEKEDAVLLATVLPSGNELELRARGFFHKKDLLAEISGDLEAMHRPIGDLASSVEKLIPCVCAECAQEVTPKDFPFRRIEERLKRGKKTMECPGPAGEDVNIFDLLHGVGFAPTTFGEKSGFQVIEKMFVRDLSKEVLENQLEMKEMLNQLLAHASTQNSKLIQIAGLQGIHNLTQSEMLKTIQALKKVDEADEAKEKAMIALVEELDQRIVNHLPQALESTWRNLQAEVETPDGGIKAKLKARIPLIPALLFVEVEHDINKSKMLKTLENLSYGVMHSPWAGL